MNIFACFLFILFYIFSLHKEINYIYTYIYIVFIRLFLFVIEYLHIKIFLPRCKGNLKYMIFFSVRIALFTSDKMQ